MMLHYCDVPFEDIAYQAKPKPEGGFDTSAWTDVKFQQGLDFPNLPYLIDDTKGVKLSETLPILRYIARTYGPGGLGANSETADMVASTTPVLFITHNSQT
mmetsp:Transcript_6077/g.13374  ORF Transcript_6077/g.13374 Transcript_6077/m.13374 type:complete len:101 (-) Transcript_6077:385-687(-)